MKYLTLQDFNEVFDIFTNQEKEEDDENVEEEEEEKEEDYEEAYYGSILMKTLKITHELNSKEVSGGNNVSVCRQTSWMMKLRGLCTKGKVLSQMWTPLQSWPLRTSMVLLLWGVWQWSSSIFNVR